MPVAKQRDFAPQFEIRFSVKPIETTSRRTGQYILADSGQQDFFQVRFAVLPKPGHMDLNYRPYPPVGSLLSRAGTIQDP